MNTAPLILRQGDVTLVRIAKLPDKLTKKPRDKGRIILAYGEVSGHAHAIADKTVHAWAEDADVTILEVREAVALLHEEHAAVEIPPGIYRARIQREYHPQEIRRVVD